MESISGFGSVTCSECGALNPGTANHSMPSSYIQRWKSNGSECALRLIHQKTQSIHKIQMEAAIKLECLPLVDWESNFHTGRL